MTNIKDILDTSLLAEMVIGGYISARQHPRYPYVIYNYAPKATFENKWNEATLTCRGLIVNIETGEVIARPFRKFFNHRQPGAPQIEAETPVVVTDKMDGSLGILYPEPSGGYAIATRGAFESPQAIRGTQIWKERYEEEVAAMNLPGGATLLFEVIYPENRVVLHYDYDDLVLLGVTDISTGTEDFVTSIFWPGKRVEQMPYRTFADALAAPPRPNAEGLVVFIPSLNDRIKIKQDDYLAMHKIVCGLNERAVWEAMMEGNSGEFIAGLPDEFQDWARKVAERIALDINTEATALREEFYSYKNRLPEGFSRKDFAMIACSSANKWAMFALLDEHDIGPELLKRARPEANIGPANLRCQNEDNS